MANPSLIKFNLLIIYLVIFVAGGGVSFAVYNTGRSIQQASESLTDSQLPALKAISELKRWVNEYERILYEFYATTSNKSDERDAIYKMLANAEKAIAKNSQLLVDQVDNQFDVSELGRLFGLLKIHAKSLDAALPPAPWDWNEARRELAIITALGQETLPHLTKLVDEIESQIESSKQISNAQLDQMSLWVGLFSSVTLIIAIWVGYFVRRAKLQAVEQQRLALFVENNPNPVACIDFEGNLAFENSAWSEHYPQQQDNQFATQVFAEIQCMKIQNFDFSQFNLREDKKILALSVHKINSLRQFMIYVEDVTEQEVVRQELEFLAYHDNLTGLPNLRRLEVDLDHLVSQGNEHPFCLVSVGVRRLQLITTTYGHTVSDALIKALVMRLQNCLTEIIPQFSKCSIYRFTGAKFEILIAGKDNLENYQAVIEQLTSKLRQASDKELQTSFGQFYLDIQAGYVLFPEHGYSATMLIKNASSALNEAQRNNTKNIVAFDHELAFREQNWYRLENDMRQAEFSQQLFVIYQPKVNLIDQKLIGMEALVRWQHPEKGLVSPVEFIPIAEESGLIIELGVRVLDIAVAQTSQWVKMGATDLQLAVNVSPSQLLSIDFVASVKAVLDRHQLAGANLEIEITEEVMVDDKTICIEVLEQLKSIGISIAMDDFGTGYSSLAYLNRFPLSKLKIDRSFVTDIHCNAGNLAIVKTIIALSKGLNIKVIAEGIEVQEEVEILNSLGCDQGQGYLFAKPLTSSEFFDKYLSHLR